MAAEAPREVSVDGVRAEVVQNHRRRLASSDELACHLSDRVATRHLGGSIGADQEESRGLAAAREEGHELGRRRIRPLQVVEDDDHWGVGAQCIECFGQLTQRAPLCRTARPLLELGQPLGANQSRHLRQPGWRVLGEDVDRSGRVRPATQVADGVEHRKIGLPTSVLFDARAAADQ